MRRFFVSLSLAGVLLALAPPASAMAASPARFLVVTVTTGFLMVRLTPPSQCSKSWAERRGCFTPTFSACLPIGRRSRVDPAGARMSVMRTGPKQKLHTSKPSRPFASKTCRGKKNSSSSLPLPFQLSHWLSLTGSCSSARQANCPSRIWEFFLTG